MNFSYKRVWSQDNYIQKEILSEPMQKSKEDK